MDGSIILAVLPQLLTLARLAAAPLLFYLIVSGFLVAAAVLLAGAMLSDFADGALTRRFSTSSRAGAYADVWADFSTLVAAFGTLRGSS
jgi:cardiolipin synthase (CMP-forming)